MPQISVAPKTPHAKHTARFGEAPHSGSVWNTLLDLVFPPRCPACDRRTADSGFCPECAERIELIRDPLCTVCGQPFTSPPSHQCARCLRRRPHFAVARACASYHKDQRSDPLASALRRYKYDRDIGLAPLLGRLLVRHCPLPPEHDIAVPVPLHRQRLRWRGFNQSALLARRLADDRGIPFAASVLQRRRVTPPQVGLSETERRANISGAFSVRDPEALRGRSVLLVDDVYTTGATANECARTMKRAGARRVDVLVLARAL